MHEILRPGMGLRMGCLRLVPRLMSGVLDDATSGVPLSMGAGTPGIAVLPGTAVEVTGMPLTTADQVSDLLNREALRCAPYCVDFTKDMFAKWTGSSSGGTADTGIIATLHLKGVKDAVLGDVTSSADITAAFPAVTTPAASIPFKSKPVKLPTANVFTLDDFIQLSYTLTSDGDASADEIVLIDVCLFYYFNPFTELAADGSPGIDEMV